MTTSTRLAISAPIALASETVAPRSTIVSAWRALTRGQDRRARRARVDLLGALALVGREQHPEALLVRVERLLQVAHRDLVGDLDEVDHRSGGTACPGTSGSRPSGGRSRRGRPAGRAPRARRRARAAGRRWWCRRRPWRRRRRSAGRRARRRPTPPRRRGRAACATTARRRARSPRAARARAGARRRRAARPASRRAAAPGESSAAIRTSPTSGKLEAMSRATSSTGTRAERVVQDDDVDLEPAQRARDLLGVGDDGRRPAAPRPRRRAPTRSGRARRRRSRAAGGAGSSQLGPRVGLSRPSSSGGRRSPGAPQREPDLRRERLRLGDLELLLRASART